MYSIQMPQIVIGAMCATFSCLYHNPSTILLLLLLLLLLRSFSYTRTQIRQETCQRSKKKNARCQGCGAECSTLKPSDNNAVVLCGMVRCGMHGRVSRYDSTMVGYWHSVESEFDARQVQIPIVLVLLVDQSQHIGHIVAVHLLNALVAVGMMIGACRKLARSQQLMYSL